MDTSTGPPTIASRDRSRRYRSVGYWVATVLVAIELGLGGIWDIARIPYVRNLVTHLGYPSYFLVLLGCWKVLGAVALLVPRRPLLKEWAYAGAFFTYTGAIVSHLTTGYALNELPPHGTVIRGYNSARYVAMLGGARMEVGVRELRNHLRRHLHRVRDGDEVVVTDRGRAIARVVPGGAERLRSRRVARSPRRRAG
jgi:prevent-host-death family protein